MTRYTDWAGVQMMALSVAARNGGTRFQVKYTNQDGVEWRLSQIMVKTSVQAIWTVAHTFGIGVSNWNQTSAFIGLQQWDTGVRKIESVTMLDPDVWLLTFVLVKPIQKVLDSLPKNITSSSLLKIQQVVDDSL